MSSIPVSVNPSRPSAQAQEERPPAIAIIGAGFSETLAGHLGARLASARPATGAAPAQQHAPVAEVDDGRDPIGIYSAVADQAVWA